MTLAPEFPSAPSDPESSSPSRNVRTASLPPETPANAKSGCNPTAASDASHAASRDKAHTPPRIAARPVGPSAGSTRSDSVPGHRSQIACATPGCSTQYAAALTAAKNISHSIVRRAPRDRDALLGQTPARAEPAAADAGSDCACDPSAHTPDTASPACVKACGEI